MGRGRRCEVCETTWPATARWCGRCGGTLGDVPDESGATVASRRRTVTDHATVVPLLVAAAVAVAAVSVAIAPATEPSDAGRVDRDEVRLGDADELDRDAADDRTGRPATDVTNASGDGPICQAGDARVGCVAWYEPSFASRRLAFGSVGADIVTVAVNGNVRARSVANGELHWETDVPVIARLDGGPIERSTDSAAWPGVDILDPVGGTVPVRSGDRIAFLAARTGRLVAGVKAPVEPRAVAGSGPWLLLTDGRRIANLAVTGTSTWTVEVPDDHDASVTPHGAYLTQGDRVEQLSSNVGTAQWETTLPGPVRPLPVSHAGAGLHAVDGDAPAVVGLDRDDGRLRWSLPVDGEVQEVTVSDGRMAVLVTGPAGPTVHLASFSDGGANGDGDEVRAGGRIRLGEDVGRVQTPVLTASTVAVVAADPGPVLTLATADGAVFARRELTSTPTAVSLPDTETVLVADPDSVRATSLATGIDRWEVALEGARLVPGQRAVLAGDRGIARVEPEPG